MPVALGMTGGAIRPKVRHVWQVFEVSPQPIGGNDRPRPQLLRDQLLFADCLIERVPRDPRDFGGFLNAIS
jgi:hypothetical protein